ncbi:MAG: 50S ribosomal protein L30 [Promethearchaeota archaeon]
MNGEATEAKTLIAVVRVRSVIGQRKDIKETVRLLNLTRVHHAIIIDNRQTNIGMLQKVKDTITWGEIDSPTLARLLRKRGRLEGNRHLTDEYIAKNANLKTIDELAKALVDFKIDLAAIPKLKKVFRLHPPSKGFRGSTKRSFQQKGELGYRGAGINGLIMRMT